MSLVRKVSGGLEIENDLGCGIKFFRSEEGWGLGQLIVASRPVGVPLETFLTEDTNYQWEPYLASSYVVVTDSPDSVVVEFRGAVGFNNMESRWLVRVGLHNGSSHVSVVAQVEPYLWTRRFHPIVLSIPVPHADVDLVSYPLEEPMKAGAMQRFTVKPDVGKAPFLLTRVADADSAYFVGVGYTLDSDQDYSCGTLVYDPAHSDSPLHILFPYERYWGPAQHARETIFPQTPLQTFVVEDDYFRNGYPYELHAVIGVGRTQWECVRGYIDGSGYSNDCVPRKSVTESVAQYMDAYKYTPENVAGYVPGLGYNMRYWSNSEERGDYYAYVFLGQNVRLAVLLYEYWCENPTETWAHDRAIEMGDAFGRHQLASGAVPRAWDPVEDAPTAVGDAPSRLSMYCCPLMTSNGAMSLHMLNGLRERYEGVRNAEWDGVASRAIGWVADRVIEADGALALNYTESGDSALLATDSWPLFALRYFAEVSDDERFARAEHLYADTIYREFGKDNDWYNGIFDNDTVRSPESGPQLRNREALTVFGYVAYLVARYNDTSESGYLQKAQDVFAYGWLSRMPVEMPGYSFQTRGILEEQVIWPFYDCPWTCVHAGAASLELAKATGDQFFADYYKVFTQTQLGFQHLGEEFPYFSSVLSALADTRGPDDRFAEITDGKFGVWTVYYGLCYLEDMWREDNAFYLSGEGWSMGLDYTPHDEVDSDAPVKVVEASFKVKAMRWDATQSCLACDIAPGVRRSGTLDLAVGDGVDPRRVTVGAVGGAAVEKVSIGRGDSIRVSVGRFTGPATLNISL